MTDSALRDTVRALDALHADLETIEKAGAAHVAADDARFAQLQKGAGDAARKSDHLEHMIELLHDQMIEGFRKLGAEIRDTRRGKNGQ